MKKVYFPVPVTYITHQIKIAAIVKKLSTKLTMLMPATLFIMSEQNITKFLLLILSLFVTQQFLNTRDGNQYLQFSSIPETGSVSAVWWIVCHDIIR